jgi:GAF domain-containing protein
LAAAIRLPVITPDVHEEPRWKPWLSLAKEGGYRACWSFPVETPARRVVGTFAMYYREPRKADAARLGSSGRAFTHRRRHHLSRLRGKLRPVPTE